MTDISAREIFTVAFRIDDNIVPEMATNIHFYIIKFNLIDFKLKCEFKLKFRLKFFSIAKFHIKTFYYNKKKLSNEANHPEIIFKLEKRMVNLTYQHIIEQLIGIEMNFKF